MHDVMLQYHCSTLITTIYSLLAGLFYFTESRSDPDENRLRLHLFNHHKEEIMKMPVVFDLPVEEKIISVNMTIMIKKLIAVVRTNWLYWLTLAFY